MAAQSGGKRRPLVLPIAIAAPLDEHGYTPPAFNDGWRLLWDWAEVRSRQHRHGEGPAWQVHRIRVDEASDLVDGSTVPIDERPATRAAAADAEREHRAHVDEIADRFIRGESLGAPLGQDFDLEREVLDAVATRLREACADDFLRRALERA